jgi:hypothetical protein
MIGVSNNMQSFMEFVQGGNLNGISLPQLKREIKNGAGLEVSTHKNINMGSHAGIKLDYGNGVADDSFKIQRINGKEFNIEVHNNNQEIMNKIESYLKTTGYEISRSAFKLKVSV